MNNIKQSKTYNSYYSSLGLLVSMLLIPSYNILSFNKKIFYNSYIFLKTEDINYSQKSFIKRTNLESRFKSQCCEIKNRNIRKNNRLIK